MLVDLGRNDLGPGLRAGHGRGASTSVDVERYSHVMHLVSTVIGELAPGRTAFDALTACFPAGTLSGAPKPRAMEIIEELEPTRRGLYGGIVGYLDFAGDADTAIAIRTALLRDGHRLRAGRRGHRRRLRPGRRGHRGSATRPRRCCPRSRPPAPSRVRSRQPTRARAPRDRSRRAGAPSSRSPVARARRRRAALGAVALWGASRGTWLTATGTVPLRGNVVATATGADTEPVLVPWALLALAAIGGLLATSGWGRRAVGVIVGVAGLWALLQAVLRLAAPAPAPLPAPARQAGRALGVQVTLVWPLLAALGGLLLLAAGALVAARGSLMPRLGARYDAPTGRARARPLDDERSLWDALDAGEDPTSGPPAGHPPGLGTPWRRRRARPTLPRGGHRIVQREAGVNMERTRPAGSGRGSGGRRARTKIARGMGAASA